jgi:hypothetical protein
MVIDGADAQHAAITRSPLCFCIWYQLARVLGDFLPHRKEAVAKHPLPLISISARRDRASFIFMERVYARALPCKRRQAAMFCLSSFSLTSNESYARLNPFGCVSA